jgi:lipoprotein-anchoring transpeptidase ErfK/SrfK
MHIVFKRFGAAGVIMKNPCGQLLAMLVIAAAFIVAAFTPARADVVVKIDKSAQRISVSVDGVARYNWPISIGRDGYGTPSGTFHPQSMMRSYFSRKYYNAPMPHAIFFYYGFAIHGTNDISRLGGPASHGCVRLHPSNAATLFSLVQHSGPRNTTIEISN